MTRSRSQTAASTEEPLDGHGPNRSLIVIGSQKHRDSGFRPLAFTEHGGVMGANILHSDRAVHMSVFVVRAFVRLREQVTANQAIRERLAEIDRTLPEHDSSLLDLYEKLLPLLPPPPDSSKHPIGFQSKGKT